MLFVESFISAVQRVCWQVSRSYFSSSASLLASFSPRASMSVAKIFSIFVDILNDIENGALIEKTMDRSKLPFTFLAAL